MTRWLFRRFTSGPMRDIAQRAKRLTMAQRLDEAFAGCDEWTVIAAPRRRSTLDFTPTDSRAAQLFDGSAMLQAEEAEAA